MAKPPLPPPPPSDCAEIPDERSPVVVIVVLATWANGCELLLHSPPLAPEAVLTQTTPPMPPLPPVPPIATEPNAPTAMEKPPLPPPPSTDCAKMPGRIRGRARRSRRDRCIIIDGDQGAVIAVAAGATERHHAAGKAAIAAAAADTLREDARRLLRGRRQRAGICHRHRTAGIAGATGAAEARQSGRATAVTAAAADRLGEDRNSAHAVRAVECSDHPRIHDGDRSADAAAGARIVAAIGLAALPAESVEPGGKAAVAASAADALGENAGGVSFGGRIGEIAGAAHRNGAGVVDGNGSTIARRAAAAAECGNTHPGATGTAAAADALSVDARRLIAGRGECGQVGHRYRAAVTARRGAAAGTVERAKAVAARATAAAGALRVNRRRSDAGS